MISTYTLHGQAYCTLSPVNVDIVRSILSVLRNLNWLQVSTMNFLSWLDNSFKQNGVSASICCPREIHCFRETSGLSNEPKILDLSLWICVSTFFFQNFFCKKPIWTRPRNGKVKLMQYKDKEILIFRFPAELLHVCKIVIFFFIETVSKFIKDKIRLRKKTLLNLTSTFWIRQFIDYY